MNLAEVIGVFLLGLLGSTHCVGMCGGFVLALSQRSRLWQRQVAYQTGRMVSYVALGAVLGSLGLALGEVVSRGWTLGAGALVMILMGLGLMGFIPRLETAALPRGFLLSRLTASLRNPSPFSGFVLGMFTGILPCGLLYAAFARAAATSGPVEGALVMLVFCLGTLPALAGVSFLAPVLQGSRFRILWPYLAGGATIFLGLMMGVSALATPEHTCCHPECC